MHRQTHDEQSMSAVYLQAPLLQAGRLMRYANSMCSCVISSGFTCSTQRQAAFSNCTRGAIILQLNDPQCLCAFTQIG